MGTRFDGVGYEWIIEKQTNSIKHKYFAACRHVPVATLSDEIENARRTLAE